MTKAGEKIIEGLHEAVAVAKGEQPAAAMWINGHRYVPAAKIEVLISALRMIADEDEIHTKLNQTRLCCKFQQIAIDALRQSGEMA